MFEKLKEHNYNCYGCRSTSAGNIPARNMKYFEIKKEDLKYESNGRAEVISYICFSDDNSRILRTIPDFSELILDCDELFNNNITSDNINGLLIKTLNEKSESLGLSIRTNNIYGIYFGMDDIRKLDLSKRQENSIRYFRDKPYDFNVPFEIPKEHEFQVISYRTMIDNTCVSSSATTYLNPFNSELVDVSIGTDENYRQKGYGVSNVVSLAEYLLSDSKEVRQVKEVMYSTNNINKNSQKTAKSAGFIEAAKEYIISCERI